MIKIKFNGSNSFRDRRVIAKNMGKATIKANFLFVIILNKKKKKAPTIIFIIKIIKIFDGFRKQAMAVITPNIVDKNISFLPNFSLASIIDFNYNRKLWLK